MAAMAVMAAAGAAAHSPASAAWAAAGVLAARAAQAVLVFKARGFLFRTKVQFRAATAGVVGRAARLG